MKHPWAAHGAAHAFIAVAAGAFGAHVLRGVLDPKMLDVFETGVRYQMFHALGLFAISWLAAQGARVNAAGWSLSVGIVLFSGSLYALALTGIHVFGAVTPVGGLCFLAGWALVFFAALRR